MQIYKATTLAVLTCFLSLQACTSQAAQPSSKPVKGMPSLKLSDYQWKNRLLLIFAPAETSEAYGSQMQLLTQKRAEMVDRDLLLVQVLNEGDSRIGTQAIEPTLSAKLREQFRINPAEFWVVLVGKDGTEKRREAAPVSPGVLFNQIDAMPMRQQEKQRSFSP